VREVDQEADEQLAESDMFGGLDVVVHDGEDVAELAPVEVGGDVFLFFHHSVDDLHFQQVIVD
jgi:hypothetical protein